MRSMYCWMATILAAVPISGRAAEVDQYLLDDTHLLIAIDVQQIRGSPLFVKSFQQQAELFLKEASIQQELKKAGLDPLADIDRIVAVMGFSSHREEVRIEAQASFSNAGGFPLILIQGRFDPDRLHAWAQEQAKATGMVKLHQSDLGRYYQIAGRADRPTLFAGYVAVVDRNLVVAGSHRDEIEDILAKKAGKKKTQLKDPGLKALLAQRDAKLAVQVLASKDVVISTSSRSITMNGQTVTEIKRGTLGDAGFAALVAGVSVSDHLQGRFTITAETAEQAAQFAMLAEQNLKAPAAKAGQVKELAPLAEAIKTVQITRQDRQVTIAGQAKPEAVMAIFLGFVR